MKKKIRKILGVGLAFMLVLSLMMFFAPVAGAADYKENDWDTWGMPAIEPNTNGGPMAITPDGVIYMGVHYYDDVDDDGWGWYDYFWKVMISEDDGYTWDDTELDGLQSDRDRQPNQIMSIVVSPNYEEDETVYVATFGPLGTYNGVDVRPTVYALTDAGDDYDAFDPLVDDVGEYADFLYDIDVWTDDNDDNWIIAGTNVDVLVIKDEWPQEWRDMDLGNTYDVSGENEAPAFEVAFAPDFDDTELIWVVTEDPDTGHFLVTSKDWAGQWAFEIDEAMLIDTDDNGVHATRHIDMAFADNYDSELDNTVVFLAVGGFDGNAGVYAVLGVEGDNDPDTADSVAIELTDGSDAEGVQMESIAVSGDWEDAVILAGEWWGPAVWISDDGGDGWDEADKNPTGEKNTYVLMEADIIWGNDIFDPEESMSFASTFGDESAISRSDPNEDGDLVYNQVGLIDTQFSEILDMAFHPDFPAEPVYLMLTFYWGWEDSYDYDTASLWLTLNGDEDEPDYMRVLCVAMNDNGAPGNFEGWLGPLMGGWTGLVEYVQDEDGSVIYLHGQDYDTDNPVIWKSTDGGQTFGSEKKVKDGSDYGWIRDWVIPDDDTIYAATFSHDDGDLGFYGTTNSGLSWTAVDTDGPMNSIAVQPGFDADEDDMSWIALGGFDGEVLLSDDAGDAFDDTAAGLTDDVFVAFDADFADEDADGYMLIYAAGQGDAIQEGEVDDTDDVDWDPLEDDEDDATQGIFATGLQVSEDNALYAIGALTEVEEEAIEVIVDGGLIVITGQDSSAIGTVTVLHEVTVISGDFRDEAITVDSESLEVAVDTAPDPDVVTVSGRVWIEGDDSDAIGYFTLSNRAVTVTSGTFTDEEEADITREGLETTIEITVSTVDAGLVRLLLHESNSEWESADDTNLTDPMGLWLSAGSNVLWTINALEAEWDEYDIEIDDGPEMWVLEDTLSGQVTLNSPSNGYKSDAEGDMRISWDEMTDADEYEVKYYHVPTGSSSVEDEIDDTDILLTDLRDTSEYEWKVRVSPGEPWHSRWSGKWSFNTALGEPPWTPRLYTPGGIWQYSGVDVDLMPAFSWESAKTADGYQFVLADNAEFTSPLVNKKTSSSAFNLDFELEYNTNYFWKVMAYKGNDALSRWSDIGAFTTVETAPPAPPAPAPPATVTQPAPAPIVLPTPIPPALLWVIIGIGAILIIAVIVLIVRTRRPV